MQQSESPPQSPSADGGLPHPELAALFATLPAPTRAAFGLADSLRRTSSRDEVRMEHLLAALWAEEERTGLGTALAGAEWPLERLLRSFALAGLDSPAAELVRRGVEQAAQLDRFRATAMPPMSREVRDALVAAGRLARPHGIEPRDLLAGAFAVRESGAVRALEELRPMLAIMVGAPEPEEARQVAPERAPADPLAPPPGSRVGAGRGAANDRAEGEDRLNFAHYVRAFADLIDSPDTRPPLTIGVFGAWGAGKSFLLHHLTDEVERRSAARRALPGRALGAWLRNGLRRAPAPPRQRAYVYCVGFNAWEYNAAEHIWPRLVRRVLDGVTRDVRWHRRPLLWAETVGRKLRRNFLRKLRADWRTLAAWIVVGAALWWGYAHLRPEQAQTFAKRVFRIDTSDDKFSVPAIVGAVTASVKLLASAIFAPLGGWVTALLDDGPGYGGESDFVRAVRADLDLVDRQLVAEGSRVLIVIDDLDRCEPDKAVEVLQAINQLLDRRSFVVCLGIDARVITAAVEKHYEELLGPAGITGYEYLDKIVQIPFRIPDPSSDDVALFVSKQLGDPQPVADRATAGTSGPTPAAIGDPLPRRDAAAVDPSGDPGASAASPTRADPPPTADAPPPAVESPTDPPAALSFTHDELMAFHEVASYIRPNPRHVKRLVNVYALVRSLATLGGSRAILDDPAATVRWLTLCAQWPYAVYAMLSFLDTYGPPVGPALPDEPPLRWLYDAVLHSLDPAKQARFDHDLASLERLVASSEGLSWAELRALRGYTVNFNPALDAEMRAYVADGAPRRQRRRTPPSGTYDRRATPTVPPPPPQR